MVKIKDYSILNDRDTNIVWELNPLLIQCLLASKGLCDFFFFFIFFNMLFSFNCLRGDFHKS